MIKKILVVGTMLLLSSCNMVITPDNNVVYKVVQRRDNVSEYHITFSHSRLGPDRAFFIDTTGKWNVGDTICFK